VEISRLMEREAQAIEVEVVAIDGATPPAAIERAAPGPAPRQPWREARTRVLQLDSRWWPLWVLLGGLAIALFLTVGVALAVVYLIFRILKGIVNAIIR
jgi:hypothetical protein